MKAVVFEILGRNMIVLDNDGGFRKLSFDGVSRVGDEIEIAIEKKLVFAHFKQIAAVAAMIIMMLGLGYGALGYYTPYAYIDVDINPSVELVLNKYMRVLDVQKLNADAEKVASDVNSFKNKDLEQAVDMLLDNVQTQKIFKAGQENVVMYTVSVVNQERVTEIKKNLQSITLKKIPNLIKKENVLTQVVSISKHNEAKKLKMSPGKIILYEKLRSVKPDAKIEDVKKMTVRETVKLIKEFKKAQKAQINRNFQKSKDESSKHNLNKDIKPQINKMKPAKGIKLQNNKARINDIKKKNSEKNITKNKMKDIKKQMPKALDKTTVESKVSVESPALQTLKTQNDSDDLGINKEKSENKQESSIKKNDNLNKDVNNDKNSDKNNDKNVTPKAEVTHKETKNKK